MEVSIWSSRAKGNAPPGYLIARIVLAPGLYVDAEMNPFTYGEWRPLLHLGSESEGESQAVCLASLDIKDGPLADALAGVVELYNATYEIRSLVTGERLHHEDGSLRGALRYDRYD